MQPAIFIGSLFASELTFENQPECSRLAGRAEPLHTSSRAPIYAPRAERRKPAVEQGRDHPRHFPPVPPPSRPPVSPPAPTAPKPGEQRVAYPPPPLPTRATASRAGNPRSCNRPTAR